MNMEFQRKLPIPKEIKEQFPLSAEGEKILKERQILSDDGIISVSFLVNKSKKIVFSY